jgi:imidazoleglycerol phosphate synthase glutamine amidotransferase subunit HisH
MRVAIVNYGMGNLGSVLRALGDLGVEAFIAEHPIALLRRIELFFLVLAGFRTGSLACGRADGSTRWFAWLKTASPFLAFASGCRCSQLVARRGARTPVSTSFPDAWFGWMY